MTETDCETARAVTSKFACVAPAGITSVAGAILAFCGSLLVSATLTDALASVLLWVTVPDMVPPTSIEAEFSVTVNFSDGGFLPFWAIAG